MTNPMKPATKASVKSVSKKVGPLYEFPKTVMRMDLFR